MHQTVTAGGSPLVASNVHVGIQPGATISARMDRLPVTRHLWMLVLLISLGGFFEIYDLIFTGYIAPGMAKSGLLATTTHAFFGFTGIAGFIAATFAGLFVGTFCFGWLPDRFGRRSVFTISLLWYSVGSAIMAFQTTPEAVILWRFLTGIGVGVEIITIDTGKYEALMADVVSRIKGGEPAFFYAWSPSWTTSELVPGKDVVWLPTPADALPPNVPNAGSALVKDVPGCAGGANPCRMAMASWNYSAVANKDFIAANAPVRALVEQIHFPSSTWSNWELAISQAHGSSAIVTTLADQWIAANKATFDRWVAAASKGR